MRQAVDGVELAADVVLLGNIEEELDTGMRVILAAKNLLRLDGSFKACKSN
jgi:hypothetical protein